MQINKALVVLYTCIIKYLDLIWVGMEDFYCRKFYDFLHDPNNHIVNSTDKTLQKLLGISDNFILVTLIRLMKSRSYYLVLLLRKIDYIAN